MYDRRDHHARPMRPSCRTDGSIMRNNPAHGPEARACVPRQSRSSYMRLSFTVIDTRDRERVPCVHSKGPLWSSPATSGCIMHDRLTITHDTPPPSARSPYRAVQTAWPLAKESRFAVGWARAHLTDLADDDEFLVTSMRRAKVESSSGHTSRPSWIRRMALSESRDLELTALCQSCGLCCDGSLFGRVRLESSEVVSSVRL
jgi:hypothetical protein